MQTSRGALVAVPGVIGDSEQAAISCLQRYGYDPQRDGSEASDLPAGLVTRTAPGEGGGTKLLSGGDSGRPVVTYRVSLGRALLTNPNVVDGKSEQELSAPPVVDRKSPRDLPIDPNVVDRKSEPDLLTVPNVVSKRLPVATLWLGINHFRLGEVTTQVSEKAPNTIIAQTPGAGSSAERGSAVHVVVSAPWPRVPQVVGANEGNAITRIKEHFAPRQAGTLSSEKPAGIVLRQEPAGGSLAPPGSDVSYWTASGQNAVPDIIRHDSAAATGELSAAGFRLGVATQRVDLGNPNIVLEQRPTPKTLANVGSPVDIWVSRELRVPDIVGAQEETAVRSLQGTSLQGQLSGESPSPEPRGNVLSTDPPAGAKVVEGSIVRYRITSGENIVPNVRGATTGTAESTLRDAGLRLGNQAARPDSGPIGIILEQRPKPGDTLPINGAVDVIVSSNLPIVPNVIGKAQLDAEAMIREAQFDPVFAGKEPSERPAGTVLRTDPVSGTMTLLPNVQYWAASGENRVPPLTDRSRAQAAHDAAAHGFVLGDVAQRYAPASTGHVLEQQPAAGELLALGSPINVTLGSGTRRVPDLFDMTPGEAASALEQASLALGDTTVEYGLTDSGRVVSQRPKAFAQIGVGEAGEVAIVVAKGILVPVIAGSTLLAALILGTWWTQLRPWPWHWPPTLGIRAHLALAESPLPEFGPLNHDPTRDIGLHMVVVPGDPVFEQQPLPIVGIKVV